MLSAIGGAIHAIAIGGCKRGEWTVFLARGGNAGEAVAVVQTVRHVLPTRSTIVTASQEISCQHNEHYRTVRALIGSRQGIDNIMRAMRYRSLRKQDGKNNSAN